MDYADSYDEDEPDRGNGTSVRRGRTGATCREVGCVEGTIVASVSAEVLWTRSVTAPALGTAGAPTVVHRTEAETPDVAQLSTELLCVVSMIVSRKRSPRTLDRCSRS